MELSLVWLSLRQRSSMSLAPRPRRIESERRYSGGLPLHVPAFHLGGADTVCSFAQAFAICALLFNEVWLLWGCCPWLENWLTGKKT